MKLSKQTIENAREIRAAASKKWSCEVADIDWACCLGMALRGETLEMENLHEYKFEIEGKYRNGGVYVAIITGPDKNFGFARQFLPLESTSDKKVKSVWGSAKLANGTIIEIATGGSAKNKYREVRVANSGELRYIGDPTDVQAKKEIFQLLSCC